MPPALTMPSPLENRVLATLSRPPPPRRAYKIGLCAMDKKMLSKPMKSLLVKLLRCGDFELVFFGDDMLLNEDVERWPQCDFLIAFYSAHFPLSKAIAYQQHFRPFSLNDLLIQQLLFDRRLVLRLLDRLNVPTPNRLVASRDGGPIADPELRNHLMERFDWDLEEDPQHPLIMIDDETIEVNGKRLSMPFVEKPVSGEDHDIRVYYDKSRGGGVRHLFRKVGDTCSAYFPGKAQLRTEGSFIYEEFIDADFSEDVKVYSVNNSFAYAESRRSPVVACNVIRSQGGREMRYAVKLTDNEKEIARCISSAFGQLVCGFDLLRCHGKSYVMDVNGWSFVKENEEFYDKCAGAVRRICLSVVLRNCLRKARLS